MCPDRRQPVTNRAAAFCTDCSRWNWLSAMPYNKALQLSRRQLINAREQVSWQHRVSKSQRLHNTAELTQLIIARPADDSDLLSHRKSIVKND